MDQQLVTRIVEAALLAASQPLTVLQLNGLVHGDNLPLDETAPEGAVEQALETLQAASAGRGVELVEVASGWRFQVQADVHPWVARLWSERQTKYTRATLETLALVAYRQPITRGEIEQIRGVAVNSNIIKALEEREWIRVVGHRDMPGKPELLGTTKAFLDYFGLKRLDELPPLSELKDFGELDPQLQLDQAPIAVDNIADLGHGDAAGDPARDDAVDGDAPASDGAPSGADDAPPGEDAGAAGQADAGTAALEDGTRDAAADAPAGTGSEGDAVAPEHDTAREERADSDPSIADAERARDGDAADATPTDHPPPHDEDPALADDGDSTRSNR